MHIQAPLKHIANDAVQIGVLFLLFFFWVALGTSFPKAIEIMEVGNKISIIIIKFFDEQLRRYSRQLEMDHVTPMNLLEMTSNSTVNRMQIQMPLFIGSRME